MTGRIIVQLLDPSEGHPLQTWTFDSLETISIGRAAENDVVVADPYVSRAHAYLRHDADGWRVISISRQQVLHRGQLQDELPLVEGLVFRLGQHGCLLRIGQPQERQGSQTIEFDAPLGPVLILDRERMQQDVNQIARGDYFEGLKDTARALRKDRTANQTRDEPRA